MVQRPKHNRHFTCTVDDNGAVTLPDVMVKELGLSAGTLLRVELIGELVVVTIEERSN